ncbi:MAG: N-acetylmuramoyl-L-alanine amidase, partial [Armatimonadetes bacterium]|nr:N-acetylmuramoyl-L-alanine amidase [Armatimonadota bacterium]
LLPECRRLLQEYVAHPVTPGAGPEGVAVNRVLAGLLGVARIAARFGDTETVGAAEAQVGVLFPQLVALLRAQGEHATRTLAQELGGADLQGNVARFLYQPLRNHFSKPPLFLDMTPELGRALRAAAPESAAALRRAVALWMPTYHLAGEERSVHYGENFIELPDTVHGLFQTHAWLWGDAADRLADQVDLPNGPADLYYIQKLVIALEGYGVTSWSRPALVGPGTLSQATPDRVGSEDGLNPPEELPRADNGSNPWKYIVIHHSASPSGNAAAFDRLHRSKGWDCVAYHFVITNGRGGPDGGLETGDRWRQQKHGAHAGGLWRGAPGHLRNEYNEFGIGICLVGNFQQGGPTAAQLETLAALVRRLQEQFQIPADRILGHRHVRDTACPGSRFPWGRLYALMGQSAPSHLHRHAAAPTTEICVWCSIQRGQIAREPGVRSTLPMAAGGSVLPVPVTAPPAASPASPDAGR